MDMKTNMANPENTKERNRVYLPENRHRWASNDEVEKPSVMLRGPNILVDDDTKYQNRLKRSPFPNLAAFTLSGVTVLVILAGVCFEVSTLLNG
ncbi:MULTISPECIES: hypothetical protein [Thalassospira]|uniref:Uncharacterized protein n=2 Tax=Thalassospiraceae TaxID=2844866 RepID=A0A8I1SKJ8_9PROT|nr:MULTISPECIES: hypothetical protein [Thalassospira]KZB65972.1 hypothetical protein AUQ42_13670 [Thalassospira sp. MCCC 1A02491]MBN8197755.1 hypothetical protein [Thalassospira povalilytica]PKR48650.1 hypothetical protein CU041_14280 [Thalassospira povalilytica]|tara:strand:+ start:129 stop:410 length:282 start_codon:yes stop_codon:yes gene_type:complete